MRRTGSPPPPLSFRATPGATPASAFLPSSSSRLATSLADTSRLATRVSAAFDEAEAAAEAAAAEAAAAAAALVRTRDGQLADLRAALSQCRSELEAAHARNAGLERQVVGRGADADRAAAHAAASERAVRAAEAHTASIAGELASVRRDCERLRVLDEARVDAAEAQKARDALASAEKVAAAGELAEARREAASARRELARSVDGGAFARKALRKAEAVIAALRAEVLLERARSAASAKGAEVAAMRLRAAERHFPAVFVDDDA